MRVVHLPRAPLLCQHWSFYLGLMNLAKCGGP